MQNKNFNIKFYTSWKKHFCVYNPCMWALEKKIQMHQVSGPIIILCCYIRITGNSGNWDTNNIII